MEGGGYPFHEFCKEKFLPQNGDLMSNFISKLVNRTFGLGEVVQPLATPIFADVKNNMDVRPRIIPHENNSTGLVGKNESSYFSEMQELPLEAEVDKRSAFSKISKQSKESIITESNIITMPNNTIDSKSYHENSDSIDVFSHQHENVEIDNTLSTDKNSVVLVQGEEKLSGNIVLQEKMNMPDAKPFERKVSSIDSSEPTTLISKFQVADEDGHSLASKSFLRSEMAANFEQPILSTTDKISEKRIASAPPTIKVSIGCVDVRAVIQKADSTPVRRVVPPKSKLSLDDYLNKRSGGER
jgi:hypothetical protein